MILCVILLTTAVDSLTSDDAHRRSALPSAALPHLSINRAIRAAKSARIRSCVRHKRDLPTFNLRQLSRSSFKFC